VSGVQLFKRSEIEFEHYGGPPGNSELARLVGTELSSTMGAGIATFDACSIEWTLLYDEVIVVLEGRFRLRVGDETVEADPGDVVWIPDGTPLRYEGDGATVFYALAPVDWRTRQG
jgi:ethanolamine utilization protein EutQ